MSKFYIKQNDTSPSIQITDTRLAGNLVGASVVFNMRDSSGTVKVNRSAGAVVDAGAGTIGYDWAAADTDTAGEFEAEFEVTYADTTVETFPNFHHISVVITDDIA